MPNRNFVYSDVNSALEREAGGAIKIEYDEDAVIQSVKNIFATIKGERVRSGLGSSLLGYLFEPMEADVADEIRIEIIRNIREYEPRVDSLKVRVQPNYDANLYRVSVDFTIDKFAAPLRFQTNLRSMSED